MQIHPDVTTDLTIPVAGLELNARLTVPSHAHGLVVFAHGSGSNRNSPRNLQIADGLQARGLATLLFDLATPLESGVDQADAILRYEVDFLAERLIAVTDWAHAQPGLDHLAIGYLGAGTGAAAAVIAAARRPLVVAAMVLRGGRTDLAGDAIALVRAPTLLVVGGEDREILAANRVAVRRLVPRNGLAIVAGATHMFAEPGALAQVTELAGQWLETHLTAAAAPELPTRAAR